MIFNNHNFRVMETSQSRNFMQRVYGWMAIALSISATSAYVVANTPALAFFYHNPIIMFVAIIAQIGLVISLTTALPRMQVSTAMIIFTSYAGLSGANLAGLFLIYTLPSLAITLAVTAGMFLAMALYGQFTKSDLSSLGDFLFMAIIGLVIAKFVGIFVGSANFSMITAAFGVMIFTLFTAYDVQMIKNLGSQMLVSHDDMTKVALIGALKLYLDFVNLFLYLLRFFGQQRRD